MSEQGKWLGRNVGFVLASRTDWPELTDWAEKARSFLVEYFATPCGAISPEQRQQNIQDATNEAKKLLAELPE